MSDMPSDQLPSLATSLLHDFAQKGLTVAATALAANGWITADHQSQFVQLGCSLAMFGASCAWTYVAARVRKKRLVAAINAPATPQSQPQGVTQ